MFGQACSDFNLLEVTCILSKGIHHSTFSLYDFADCYKFSEFLPVNGSIGRDACKINCRALPNNRFSNCPAK